jgi:cytochrome c-type biogenesis protein CcmH/NrfG
MIKASIISSALLFVFSVVSYSQTAADKQQEIQAHIRQAQAYLNEKKPDLAIAEYNAVLASDPNNLDARANLGVVYFFNSDYGKATHQLRSALKLRPGIPKLQALLGMSEKRAGENKIAQSDLEQSFDKLKDERLRVQAGMELIEVDYALSDLGKAAEIVNVLRQIRPTDVDILYTAHRIYSELSDETMLSLAMIAPNSARMHQLMGHELARQANNEGAIANYREALKLNPQLSDIHFELAEMLNTSSSATDRAEAEKEYKAALAENPFDEKSLCKLGDIALRRSDLDTASDYYARALKLEPNDVDANLGMARILMNRHEPKKAEPHLERAVQLEPFSPVSHYRLGVLYRELGRPDDAHRELAEFEKLKKMKARLGDIYQQMRLQPGKQDQSDTDLP